MRMEEAACEYQGRQRRPGRAAVNHNPSHSAARAVAPAAASGTAAAPRLPLLVPTGVFGVMTRICAFMPAEEAAGRSRKVS